MIKLVATRFCESTKQQRKLCDTQSIKLHGDALALDSILVFAMRAEKKIAPNKKPQR
jgi:hypothetical protein